MGYIYNNYKLLVRPYIAFSPQTSLGDLPSIQADKTNKGYDEKSIKYKYVDVNNYDKSQHLRTEGDL